MLCPTNEHIGIPFCSLLIKSEYLGFVLVFYLIKWYLIKIIVRKQTKGIVQISKSMKEFSDKTKVNREGKKGVPVLTTTIVISIIKLAMICKHCIRTDEGVIKNTWRFWQRQENPCSCVIREKVKQNYNFHKIVNIFLFPHLAHFG